MFRYGPLRLLTICSVLLLALPACRSIPILAPSVHVSGSTLSGQGGPPAHAPAHGRRAHHNYYYYPDAEVYFDIHRHSYFYLSGGHWQVSATLPRALRLHLGGHISLEMETAIPYRFHHKHKKSYPRGHFKKQRKQKYKKNKKNNKKKHY